MRDVMQGISNIQNTLANLLLRINGGRQLDAVTNEISGKKWKSGIEERLDNVKHQANDTMYNCRKNKKKTERKF